MIVAGAASGIGVETARALARTGAEVTLAVRDTEAGEIQGISGVRDYALDPEAARRLWDVSLELLAAARARKAAA